jgi:hypothetical protein
MTRIIDSESKRRLPAQLAAGLAISALLVLGAFVAPAGAQVVYGGSYYAAPPVVYGSPYYAPPPVVYGPAVGVNLPGVSIGIF